jgi:transposase
MVQVAPWANERLLRRPAQEDRRGSQARHHQDRGPAHSFGVSRSSVKRYAKLAERGLPLAPKKRPGSKPKIDEAARRLLEADVEERPSATLAERREYLGRISGLWVSESTLSRMLRRLGWSRKKGRWERVSATSS